MKEIENENEYREALKMIDELVTKVGDDESFNNPDVVLLDRTSDLVADYEDIHFKIGKPSLIDVIKLRMYERGLNQEDLAELLEVPKSRISEYLKGKRDITLEVARKLHSKLNIDGDIILQ